MSELRKDPLLQRWVIVAPDRLKRPNDYRRPEGVRADLCPFCPGHENFTPPEVLAVRPNGEANKPGWTLRVVPNRFPALGVEGQLERSGAVPFEAMTGIGAHEVVIESPRHDAELSDLDPSEIEAVLWAWSERIRDLSGDIRLESISVFRNRGEASGATLQHPHSQIVALPLVPRTHAMEMESAADYLRERGRCLFCDLIATERSDGSRLVLDANGAVAIMPWAARAPFETWILPEGHGARFEHTPREALRGVAAALRTVLRKLAVALEKPAYNIMLHTAPLRSDELRHYHWRLEVSPALTPPAGLEWSTGCFINPVPPEEAAPFLRRLPD